jgi:antitoxin component of MazEF toxin-antitoxin module
MKSGQSTVALWGQSAAVCIPSDVLDASGLHVGQQAEFESTDTGAMWYGLILTRKQAVNNLACVRPWCFPMPAIII